MENSLPCTICGEVSARYCDSCRSAAYCSPECQQTDWRPHQLLCHQFKELSASGFSGRPSASHFLAICFPMTSPNPQLVWIDTEEIEEHPGYFNPKLESLLQIPGNGGYVRPGFQCVRGNILRGRRENADTLNIWYLDDHVIKNLQVNQCLHGTVPTLIGDTWGEKIWQGPLVAVMKQGHDYDPKEVRDMTLTGYRDAIDYLGYFRDDIGSMIDGMGVGDAYSKRTMGERIGKVKGVRINCLGDQGGDSKKELVQVDVPKTHPLFNLERDNPLPISRRLEEWWVWKQYASKSKTSAGPQQNPTMDLLLLQGPSDEKEGRGSVLLVNDQKQDLLVDRVRAVRDMVENKVMPLISASGSGDEAAKAKASVLETVTLESLEPFLGP